MTNIKFETVKKVAEANFKVKNLGTISKLDSVSPPSVFIGSGLRYPFMNVGILSPVEREENAWVYDDSKYWAKENFDVKDVLKLRNGLVNSRFLSRSTDARQNKKFLDIAKEIAMSQKSVDVEIELKNRLIFKNRVDSVLTPHGLSASLKKAKITSNVKISSKVDRVVDDEIKASEGIKYLYKNKFDEYALNKILSVGVLGLKKNKKLVPTRWSITATDDILTKNLLNDIRDFKPIRDFQLFFGEFMGNQFLIAMFPSVWNYELFEIYYPGSSFNPGKEFKASTDSESFFGRKGYAINCVGGYYAARWPIVEYLNSIKRQASVLVIRLETPSYWAKLGVWVVRESVRKALKKNMKFESREELINGLKQVCKIKYNFDCESILKKSKLLNEFMVQRRLMEYF